MTAFSVSTRKHDVHLVSATRRDFVSETFVLMTFSQIVSLHVAD